MFHRPMFQKLLMEKDKLFISVQYILKSSIKNTF